MHPFIIEFLQWTISCRPNSSTPKPRPTVIICICINSLHSAKADLQSHNMHNMQINTFHLMRQVVMQPLVQALFKNLHSQRNHHGQRFKARPDCDGSNSHVKVKDEGFPCKISEMGVFGKIYPWEVLRTIVLFMSFSGKAGVLSLKQFLEMLLLSLVRNIETASDIHRMSPSRSELTLVKL